MRIATAIEAMKNRKAESARRSRPPARMAVPTVPSPMIASRPTQGVRTRAATEAMA